MVVCCHCNRDGKCKNCSCVKANRLCTTCLPFRRGHCSNIKQPPASSPPVSCSAPSQVPPPMTSSLPSATDSTVALDSPPAISATATPTTIASTPALSGRFPSNAHHLPSFKVLTQTPFVWGDYDSTSFMTSLSAAYLEVVHWKRNTFQVPLGKGGKEFVKELSRLFRAYSEPSALEPIALKAISVLSVLALQKPSSKPKTKELNACLERRMAAWAKGDINSLLEEGRCLQKRLPQGAAAPRPSSQQNLARTFSNLMFKGKTSAALDLICSKGNSTILHANDPAIKDDPSSPSVLDVLKSKHPTTRPASEDALLSPHQEPPTIHPVIFDRIDAGSIRFAALSTKGAAGPSGLDAHCWRRLCTSFHSSHMTCAILLPYLQDVSPPRLLIPKALQATWLAGS